jgi:GNAT superfamily N-acetyltransferase
VGDAVCQARPAGAGDAEAVADLAAGLAQSFPFSRATFGLSYPALLADDDACLLLAVDGEELLGYLLGFRHLTFYANGPAGWVEEVFVRGQDRARGVGRALMSALRALGGRPGLRTGRAGDPAGGALLPRAGIRGVRRLLPQDPRRPGRHLRWVSARSADLGLDPAASKMPIWSAMPTRRASSPW